MRTKDQTAHLTRIKERKTALYAKRATARKTLDMCEQDKDAEGVTAAQTELDNIQAELDYVRELELTTLRQLSQGSAIDRLGESLRNNLDAQRALTEIAASSAPLRSNITIGTFMGIDQVAELTGRSLMAAPVSVPDSGGASGFLGIAPTPVVPTTLLDLFQSVPFTTRTADLLRRSGVAAAAIAPHGSVKQEAALTYEADSLRAVTVASWIKANRQDLDDVEALSADISQALQYGVLAAVERLLLDGAPADADGPAVPGILDNPFEPTVTATTLDGVVGQMKAQLIPTGVVPNFAAANAVTIEEEEARVGSDGHPIGAITPDGRIRRLPLVSTEALDDGQVLVGDSRVGARLGVRQGIGLVAGQESDDLTRNRVTVLVEGRWTPLVQVPTAFAVHDLTPAA
ncbi:phage major capsid protein [Conexibacter sp. SYSU D00693]|uniref:phage major capsid family protein n=1 Tax=Conexibacter sp. SYSU D00693 TaxID=2812560 RepID=UPI00196B04D2|nr:phage major capsid protein [Conexibacter sp. SYSU D00693]